MVTADGVAWEEVAIVLHLASASCFKDRARETERVCVRERRDRAQFGLPVLEGSTLGVALEVGKLQVVSLGLGMDMLNLTNACLINKHKHTHTLTHTQC